MIQEDKKTKLSENIKLLRLANTAYAQGQPFMTDEEYDNLWQDIREDDPTCPDLYHTARDPNRPGHVPHKIPLMSPLKAFDEADLKPFLARFKHATLQVQPKYDGIAAVVYNQGRDSQGKHKLLLVKSGDGFVGEDISHHLPAISLPYSVYNKPITSVEILIPLSKWNPAWGMNPRNTTAGWINRAQVPYPNVLHAVDHEATTFSMDLLPPHNLEKLQNFFLKLYSEWSTQYPMDGLMLKVANPKLRTQTGHNGQTYLWSIAWKPPIQSEWTTVKQIHWEVSRQGRVIPTVEYQPLELCGTVNRFVTGNNAQWVFDRGIHPGAQILVGKAGEIIPRILEVTSVQDPTLPDVCPVCGSPLSQDGVHLVCNHPECVAQLVKTIAYFYSDKGMDLKSIGASMIEQLLQNVETYQILKHSPWALLDPEAYPPRFLETIYSVWGTARTETYLDNLSQLQGAKNPAHFIAALGLPNLAYKSALTCFQAFIGHATYKHPTTAAVQSFVQGVDKFQQAMREIHNFYLAELPTPAVKTYCITGTLSVPRGDMIDYLSQFGWQAMNQVSKNVDYLILGELPKVSTKLQKARSLGVTTITEDEIPNYLPDKEDPPDEDHNQTNGRD